MGNSRETSTTREIPVIPAIADDAPGAAQRYSVRISYSEPGYARARGIEESLYTSEFEVTALSPDKAIAAAAAVFHEAQRSSGVSWAREVQAVTWRLLDE